MYSMVNDQQKEFNHFSKMKNHSMTMRPLMRSKIEAMESDLNQMGIQIKESNILPNILGSKNLNQEK